MTHIVIVPPRLISLVVVDMPCLDPIKPPMFSLLLNFLSLHIASRLSPWLNQEPIVSHLFLTFSLLRNSTLTFYFHIVHNSHRVTHIRPSRLPNSPLPQPSPTRHLHVHRLHLHIPLPHNRHPISHDRPLLWKYRIMVLDSWC